VLGTSNPGTVATDFGGVARNVAQNLANLGCRVMLCSRVGNDEAGRRVVAQPLDTSLITISESRPTASYTAILETTGELVIGLADMDAYDEVTPAVLSPALPRLHEASLWFLDANLPGETIDWLLASAGEIPIAVDAISVAKSRRLPPLLPRIRYFFCNVAQAGAMAGTAFGNMREAAEALRQMGAAAGIVSAGAKGIAVYDGAGIRTMRALEAKPRDVTGAGDALVSGTLYGLVNGLDLCEAARLGLAAAAITVESASSTASQLTAEALVARA
jgi:pseudouridine kinase